MSNNPKHVKIRGFIVPLDGLKIGDQKTGIRFVNNHTGAPIESNTRVVARLNGRSGIGLESFKPKPGQEKNRFTVVNSAEELCVLLGVQPMKPWYKPRKGVSISTAIMDQDICHKGRNGSIMARVMIGETPVYLISSTGESIEAGASVEVSHSHGYVFLVKPVAGEANGITRAREIPGLLGVDIPELVNITKLVKRFSARRGSDVEVYKVRK